MPELTSSTSVTLAASAAAVPSLTAFGVSIGLRPDILVAGFAGALAGVILLNSVPGAVDTWRALLASTVKRFFVVLASALTAGYSAPSLAGGLELPHQLLAAFVIGAGAQQVLAALISRVVNRAHAGGDGS
jgi:hypothetical protein